VNASSSLVSPAHCTHPPYARTLGPEVADLATLAGLEPDPEQRMILDLFFALGPTGASSTFENAAICARQNLKTGVFKMAALGWLFVTDQRLVVWSAHEFGTAQEAFRDMIELVEGSDWLRRRVRNVFRGTGDEAIEMRSGARLIFKARTRSAGRGLTGDKVVLDEAFALKPMHMGALLPTMSARPDPQVFYGSSAGLVDSAVLRAIRDRGRKGDASLTYVEFCDDLGGECLTPECTHAVGSDGCRLDDRRRWRRANPAIGRRISEEHIAKERQGMPPEEFARERLGWWDAPPDVGVDPAIDLSLWAQLTDKRSGPEDPVAFGFDVVPDRRAAAICAAGYRADGLIHLEVIDARPGTEWVAPRLAELKRNWRAPAIVGDKATCEALAPALEKAKVRPKQTSASDMAAACAQLYDLATTLQIRHLGEPEFPAALAIAEKRELEGGWAWSKRHTDGDITALVAGTLAVHGLLSRGKKRPKLFISMRELEEAKT